MCVLVVKNKKYGKTLRAKSRIVVLGNFEDRLYQKSQRDASVLKYSSQRILKYNQWEIKGYSKKVTARTRSVTQP